jgi:hypothetical protein
VPLSATITLYTYNEYGEEAGIKKNIKSVLTTAGRHLKLIFI